MRLVRRGNANLSAQNHNAQNEPRNQEISRQDNSLNVSPDKTEVVVRIILLIMVFSFNTLSFYLI